MPNPLPLLAFVLLASLPCAAQELNCLVNINADQVATTERRVFEDMETAFAQFMSTRKWTEDEYTQEEKINCVINITIDQMPSIGNFSATVQIQSARPIFNTNYETILLNFADRDWQFEYVESQPMEFNDNTFLNNLTSMLAYYAYIILGMDYDSFSELGGTLYYQRALDIVNNAQQSNRPGWEQIGSNRNRYWLVENFINTQMEEIRKGLYTYHRLALDTYSDTPDESRTKILEVLKALQEVRKVNPSAILVISFMDAKSDELVNIYSEGNIQTRRQAYDIMSILEPSKQEEFKKIIDN